jgi:hypothetical protein
VAPAQFTGAAAGKNGFSGVTFGVAVAAGMFGVLFALMA